MNILWIEDNIYKEQLEEEFFLATELFEGGKHTITKPNSLEDAFEEVSWARERADYVVLDINLENFENCQIGEELMSQFGLTNEQDFLTEAGFHLYIQLLNKGFDKDRIIFLTGNSDDSQVLSLRRRYFSALKNSDFFQLDIIIDLARKILKKDEYNNIVALTNKGNQNELKEYWNSLIKEYGFTKGESNSYNVFETRFKEARLPVAFAISKNNIEDFHSWLQDTISYKHPDYYYLQLRRGIINGCRYFKDKLISASYLKNNIFNRTLPEEQILNANYFQMFLTRIEQILPFERPIDEESKNNLFYSFLLELSALWDKSTIYLSFDNYNIDSRYKIYCRNQMKLLRNWTAHDQLKNELSESTVAFFFITAMHGLFDTDITELKSYESELLLCMKDRKKKIDQGYLARTYFLLLENPIFKTKLPIELSYYKVFRSIGITVGRNANVTKEQKESLKAESLKYFYNNFVHSISHSPTNIISHSTDKVNIKLSFKVGTLPETGIVHELLKKRIK